MPDTTTALNPSTDSPAVETTQSHVNAIADSLDGGGIADGITPRSQFQRNSFTAHLNKSQDSSADASQASGVDAQPASADPADYRPSTGDSVPSKDTVDSDDGDDGRAPVEPSTVGGLPNDPAEDLPWHRDARFQQFLAERKAFEAQKAEVERLKAFAPLVQQLTDQGYSDYNALQARIEEQNRQAEAQRQQAEDAAYQQQLQQQAEARFIDETDQQLFVEMHMRTLRAERASEAALAASKQAEERFNQTLASQAEQERAATYAEIVASEPIFKEYAPDPQTGKGLYEQILADYALQGMAPQALRGLAGDLATRLKAQREADIAAAKVEAAKALKKSNGVPATTGTRGQSGGAAPASGLTRELPQGAGFRNTLGLFTRHLDKRHV